MQDYAGEHGRAREFFGSPLVFTLNSVSWRIGVSVSPFIGGFLATPASYYPGIFGGTLWERYPYALSGVAVSPHRLCLIVDCSADAGQ